MEFFISVSQVRLLSENSISGNEMLKTLQAHGVFSGKLVSHTNYNLLQVRKNNITSCVFSQNCFLKEFEVSEVLGAYFGQVWDGANTQQELIKLSSVEKDDFYDFHNLATTYDVSGNAYEACQKIFKEIYNSISTVAE